MPGGGSARREVVEHYGAVAVVALDEDGNVVLVYQYRHPLGRRLWNCPRAYSTSVANDPR